MQRPPARVFAPHLGRSDLAVTVWVFLDFAFIFPNPMMPARARG